MRRFIYFVYEVIAKRRSAVIPADAVGTFEISGTYTTIDTTLTSGSFDIAGTYTVA